MKKCPIFVGFRPVSLPPTFCALDAATPAAAEATPATVKGRRKSVAATPVEIKSTTKTRTTRGRAAAAVTVEEVKVVKEPTPAKGRSTRNKVAAAAETEEQGSSLPQTLDALMEMKVTELRSALKERDLIATGVKAVLAQRLLDHLLA